MGCSQEHPAHVRQVPTTLAAPAAERPKTKHCFGPAWVCTLGNGHIQPGTQCIVHASLPFFACASPRRPPSHGQFLLHELVLTPPDAVLASVSLPGCTRHAPSRSVAGHKVSLFPNATTESPDLLGTQLLVLSVDSMVTKNVLGECVR